MCRQNINGTLLFELFVALMFLSIGIVSILHIFSQALYSGKYNEERTEVKHAVNHYLFPWFAYPGGVKLSEGGMLTFPFESSNGNSSFFVQMQFQSLNPPTQEGDNNKSSQKNTQSNSTATPTQQSLQTNEYYKVNVRATKENQDRELVSLDTVVFKTKQPDKK